jgi:tRNA (guanine37-N1)-methyltransferase
MTHKVKFNEQDGFFIKLNKFDVQSFIDLVQRQFRSKSIIEYRYKFINERDFILIPLNHCFIDDLQNYIDTNSSLKYEIVRKKVIKNPKFKYKTIEDLLKEETPKWNSELIPKSYDIIGSIAIIEFSNLDNLVQKEKTLFKEDVAKAIVMVNKSVKSVYEKVSQVKGEYRLRKLQILFGNDEPETIHNENHAVFKLNVKETYFTPRLVTERKRVVNSNISKGELIVDMFAGVGPFSIQIAKKRDVKIYSFDINVDAYKYLKENIYLNHVEKKVFPFNIDIKTLLESENQQGNLLRGKIDRIIMNLPEKSLEFLDIACFLMKKSGGIIHNYQFCSKPKPIELGIEQFTHALSKYQYKIEDIIHADIVKSYSPLMDLISLDIKIIAK